MNQLLQRYATISTAALFCFMGLSGVLMFVELGGPLREAHEWLGLVFVASVALHVLRNKAAFLKLLTFKRTYVALAAVFLAAAFMLEGEEGGSNPMRQLAQQSSQAPISALAPVLGVTTDEVLARLAAGGISNATASQSLQEVAKTQNTEFMRVVALAVGSTAQGSNDDDDEGEKED